MECHSFRVAVSDSKTCVARKQPGHGGDSWRQASSHTGAAQRLTSSILTKRRESSVLRFSREKFRMSDAREVNKAVLHIDANQFDPQLVAYVGSLLALRQQSLNVRL